MAVHIAVEKFEGPLDLLLHLISRARIDIRDIFVSEITQQYLEAVQNLDGLDMETASEFLAMAATLIEIKSRALLPKPPKPQPEEEEDPQALLIRRLLEYKAFKEASERMREMEREAGASLSKLPEEMIFPPQTPEWTGFTVPGLRSAFLRLLRRQPREEARETARAIWREEFSVPQQMETIREKLRKGSVDFDALFSESAGKYEVIVTFLAMLELLKLGWLRIEQESAFGRLRLWRETDG